MAREYRCAEPNCGKCFVRPEHLSRHRLNHQPKRIYECHSCAKRFVRNDLLKRHLARHERGMWHRNSGGLLKSSNGSSMPTSNTPGELESHADIPPPLDVAKIMQGENEHVDPTNQAFESSNTGNVSSLFWDPSFSAPDPLLDLDWFFENVPSNLNVEINSEVISPTRFSPPNFPMSQTIHYPEPSDDSDSSGPWVIVQSRLFEALSTLPQAVLASSFFLPHNLSNFYDLYFQNYHSHFPILHPATMNPIEDPPLLIVAVITLGSTLAREDEHFEIANTIHDSLRYIIFNTPDFEPPAKLWCVQCLLLLQAHEKMFSTRKHHQLAHIFHSSVITLMKRGVSYMDSSNNHVDPPEKNWREWVQWQSSNRTAFFGFIMDTQHATIFNHTSCLSVSDVRLPLPCSEDLWSCKTASEWNEMFPKSPEPLFFLPTLKRLIARTPIPAHCTEYGRLILLHGLFSITTHLKERDSVTLLLDRSSSASTDSWKDTMEQALGVWAYCLVSRSSSLALEASKPLYRMAYVAMSTNITDMHILAGAPSLLGNLVSDADMMQATTRVQAWSENPEAKQTLYHCLLLIQEVLFTGKPYHACQDNLSLRPWSLYHAALILWSFGFMAGRRSQTQVQEGSCNAEEYLIQMIMLLRNDQDISIISQQTRELLRAVQESLKFCRWELLREAFVTLGRLIDSGSKD